MIDAPLGLAFAAGLVATINPCGFAMLPAYLSYFLGLEGQQGDTKASPGRALAVGGVVSLGFLVVFGLTGVLINAGLTQLTDALPYLAIVIGVGLFGLGIAMMRGFELTVALPKMQKGTGSRQWRSVFLFGVSYATASLSCTLPVFLVVVVSSLSTTSFVGGVATFLAYGLGMSLVLIALTVTLGAARGGLLRRLRVAMQYVNRASAAMLILAGVYIVWFWVSDLTSDASETSWIARTVDGWSSDLTNLVDRNSNFLGWLLAGIVLAAVVGVVWRPQSTEIESEGQLT
ncbi:MAG: cytochrome c biogenesis CcdA family protein [Acidimicrobiales bacterium]|jgi:cytochrome c-type biogenesis protein